MAPRQTANPSMVGVLLWGGFPYSDVLFMIIFAFFDVDTYLVFSRFTCALGPFALALLVARLFRCDPSLSPRRGAQIGFDSMAHPFARRRAFRVGEEGAGRLLVLGAVHGLPGFHLVSGDRLGDD